MNHQSQLVVAVLPWGDLIEDFLDSINVSFESFCNEMTGGWLFGYVEALKRVNVRTVVFCISNRVAVPERHIHKPTGATICVLPSPSIHRLARRPMLNPYGWTFEETFGNVQNLHRPFLEMLRHVVPYLATPLLDLARELRRENCQVILCQEYEYARFDICVLLGLLMRLPVFATFQGGNFQLSRLERLFRPVTIRLCAGLVVATQAEIQRLQSHYNIPLAKIARIFNPLDVLNCKAVDRHQARSAIEISPGAQVVIYHGRIEIHRKGLDILIAAWEQVCRDRPDQDLCLLLIGTGSDAEQLHQLIAAKQLTSVVWIDEYVQDRSLIQQYLSAADLYTLSSRHEGFPVAPLEAMACSLPVIATRVSGIADILEGETMSGGLIVPSEDAAALARAIGQVLDDQTLRYELSDRARQRVEEHFSLDSIGEQLRMIFVSAGTRN